MPGKKTIISVLGLLLLVGGLGAGVVLTQEQQLISQKAAELSTTYSCDTTHPINTAGTCPDGKTIKYVYLNPDCKTTHTDTCPASNTPSCDTTHPINTAGTCPDGKTIKYVYLNPDCKTTHTDTCPSVTATTQSTFCTESNQQKMSSSVTCVSADHGTFSESNGQGCCTLGVAPNLSQSCLISTQKPCPGGATPQCSGTTWSCPAVTPECSVSKQCNGTALQTCSGGIWISEDCPYGCLNNNCNSTANQNNCPIDNSYTSEARECGGKMVCTSSGWTCTNSSLPGSVGTYCDSARCIYGCSQNTTTGGICASAVAVALSQVIPAAPTCTGTKPCSNATCAYDSNMGSYDWSCPVANIPAQVTTTATGFVPPGTQCGGLLVSGNTCSSCQYGNNGNLLQTICNPAPPAPHSIVIGKSCSSNNDCQSGTCYAGNSVIGGSPFDSTQTCHAATVAQMNSAVETANQGTLIGGGVVGGIVVAPAALPVVASLALSLSPIAVTQAVFNRDVIIENAKYNINNFISPTNNFYILELNKTVYEENGNIYDANTNSLLGPETEFSGYHTVQHPKTIYNSLYLPTAGSNAPVITQVVNSAVPILDSIVGIDAHTTITQSTFDSKVWTQLSQQMPAVPTNKNTPTLDYLKTVTSLVNSNVTYMPALAQLFETTNYNPSPGAVNMTSLLPDTTYQTIQDKINSKATVCFDFAITENLLLASQGVNTTLSGSNTAEHAFLTVKVNNLQYVLDPTNNVVMEKGAYEQWLKFNDLAAYVNTPTVPLP